MKHDEFIGEVQHRCDLASRGEAIRATRAVLTTLGERLQPGEAADLAAPLPMEIDYYLLSADHGQRFDFDEFVDRVADRAVVDEGEAAFYAQAIVDLLADTVPGGEIDDLKSQLPDDYEALFEIAEGEATPWE